MYAYVTVCLVVSLIYTANVSGLPPVLIVDDINLQPASSNPASLTQVNNTCFFSAYTAPYGCEIWKTDGSEAGTALVADLVPEPDSSNCSGFTRLDGQLLFFVLDGPQSGLWESNGLTEGTLRLIPGEQLWQEVESRFAPAITVMGDKVLFFSYKAVDGQPHSCLWTTNGTVAGTKMLKEFAFGSPTALGVFRSQAYFALPNESGKMTVWGFQGQTTEFRTSIRTRAEVRYRIP